MRMSLSTCYGTNTDFFRFIYHYTVENAPNHFPKMQNYVAIYGFLRTITFILVLFFLALVIHVGYFPLSVKTLVWLAFTVAITFSFYLAFVKFYRRFSLEVLMALAAIHDVSRPTNPNAGSMKGEKKTSPASDTKK